ncbi:MAG: lipid A biosynthesis acyltransferase [Rugosibacter sp.]|nr:MAG: lipid A biosynthesis acyltransferase [Rugosibacter sp.]
MTHLLLAIMWLLHWLPLPLLSRLGRGLGWLLYAFVRERRHITLTNLGLCFPQLSAAEKSALARRHFAYFGRNMLELGLWWWASAARIRRLVKVTHGERLAACHGRPVILFAPHFVGLDAGWIRLAMDHAMVTIYARAKNRTFDAALRRGRLRFGKTTLFSRQQGVKSVIRPMREGRPFYYLPDMDYGAKDAVFVPFFGVPAATITGLSRLAKLTGATVIPIITRMVGNHYEIEVGEPWTDFPAANPADAVTDNVVADTRRMNAFLETEILRSPAQYYWLHKRFKTRPPGEAGFYGSARN